MKKYLFAIIAALCCATMGYAVPAPTNLQWEGTTLKWELPALTNDSTYEGVYLSIYSKTGGNAVISQSGTSGATTSFNFSSYMFSGRTYYVTLCSVTEQGTVYSPEVTSPDYVASGDISEVLNVPNVTLSASGEAAWGNINYIIVRVTLQKKNGLNWDDVKKETTASGWTKSVSFGAITTPGTYRAMAEGLQGTDVVRRGYSAELEVDELFTVTFNANGLSPFALPDPIITAKNSKIDAPVIPDDYRYKKNGHFFYWSSDAAGDKVWVFSKNYIISDTTLYAQWRELPALNPVWDVDTCQWTFAEKYFNAFDNLSISIIEENDIEITASGTGTMRNRWFVDRCFPGRKYKFAIILTDYFYNDIADTSELHTISGEATVLPLENMAVDNVANARITWDAPKVGQYMRHGVLSQWNKGTSVWDEVATFDDPYSQSTITWLKFDYALDNEKYYRIQCRLNHGAYVIYESEIFYGTNPATGIEAITNDQSPMTNKMLCNGQILILRGDKTYTVTGQEVK